MAERQGDTKPVAGALPLSIAVAAYVGLPFVRRGDDGSGFECWDLVRLVFGAERGIDLPKYGEISAADLADVAAAFDQGMASETWRPVTVAKAFDVVVMRARDKHLGARNRHCGVMVGESRMLHLEINTHSVCVPLDHASVKFRIIGFFRHRDLA